MKKQYHIPTTRVVILDTEDTILAASGERADNAGILCIYPQRDNGQGDFSSKDWSESPLSGSPW